MWYRRITYAALVGLAVLFQIFFRFYLSTFTLVLVLVLPVLSVLLSLPAVLGASLSLSASAPTVVQGETARFRLTLRAGAGLPLIRPRVRLSWTNQLTGEGGRVLLYPAGEAGLEVCPAHCGRLVCRVEGAWACDLLGLFPLPLRAPGPASLLSLPRPLELEVNEGLLGGRSEGATLRPRPGGGPGEDYDLRDYRPGDPLRSVHWKLSSKRDELVVKEVLEPQRAALVLTYDHFGPPEELDRAFARLRSLSLWLLARDRPHHVQWAEPRSGAVQDRAVGSEGELLACLELALSQAAPEEGRSILDQPLRLPGAAGPVRHIHITPTGLEGGAP